MLLILAEKEIDNETSSAKKLCSKEGKPNKAVEALLSILKTLPMLKFWFLSFNLKQRETWKIYASRIMALTSTFAWHSCSSCVTDSVLMI